MLNTGLDLLASRRFVALEFAGDDGTRTSRSSAGSSRAPSAPPRRRREPRGRPPADPEPPRHGGPSARTFMLRRVDRSGRGARHAHRRGEPGIPVGLARLEHAIARPPWSRSRTTRDTCSSVRPRPSSSRSPIRSPRRRRFRPGPGAAGRPLAAVRVVLLAGAARRGVRRTDLDAGAERVGRRGARPAGAVFPDGSAGSSCSRASACWC